MSLITLGHGTPHGFAPDARIAVGLYHAAAATMRLCAEIGPATAGLWRARRSPRWLNDADDAVLRDLGIARSDIPRLARMGRS
jgi:uncharacterized protein YjiS (DUF1127 family)